MTAWNESLVWPRARAERNKSSMRANTGAAPDVPQNDFVWPATGVISQNAAEHKASEHQYAEDVMNPGANVAVVAGYDGRVISSFSE